MSKSTDSEQFENNDEEASNEEAARDSQIEDNYGDESEEALPYNYSITSYGADYPIDGLVKRIANGDILIPSFQRGFVWSPSKASRFVESLLLGLPVPSIFLSKEPDSQKLLVIDGQQRLRTLQFFYEGLFKPTGRAGIEFALTGLKSHFNNATYQTLSEDDRRRLDDSIMHAIVVHQEQPSKDVSSVYHIFERINTGGVFLTPQEIRAAIYHGAFNNLLKSLNENPDWRAIFGPVNKYMRDQELILRFLALLYNIKRYSQPMKEFLNRFMSARRKLDDRQAAILERAFASTIKSVRDAIGDRAFRPVKVLNAAVFDAVMVGVATRLASRPIANAKELKEEYDALLESADFADVTVTGTTHVSNVRTRVRLAISAFASVQ